MKRIVFKVITIGDGAVGKTAITIRTCHNRFEDSYKMTIGVDFGTKIYTIKEHELKLQIWDTAGQERFRFLHPPYYFGAHGALLVYDVASEESFKNIPVWMSYLVATIRHPIPTILVGNKCDLSDLRAIATEKGEVLAKGLSKHYQIDIPFYETSAKTNSNIEKVFLKLSKLMLDYFYDRTKAKDWENRTKNYKPQLKELIIEE